MDIWRNIGGTPAPRTARKLPVNRRGWQAEFSAKKACPQWARVPKAHAGVAAPHVRDARRLPAPLDRRQNVDEEISEAHDPEGGDRPDDFQSQLRTAESRQASKDF